MTTGRAGPAGPAGLGRAERQSWREEALGQSQAGPGRAGRAVPCTIQRKTTPGPGPARPCLAGSTRHIPRAGAGRTGARGKRSRPMRQGRASGYVCTPKFILTPALLGRPSVSLHRGESEAALIRRGATKAGGHNAQKVHFFHFFFHFYSVTDSETVRMKRNETKHFFRIVRQKCPELSVTCPPLN